MGDKSRVPFWSYSVHFLSHTDINSHTQKSVLQYFLYITCLESKDDTATKKQTKKDFLVKKKNKKIEFYL